MDNKIYGRLRILCMISCNTFSKSAFIFATLNDIDLLLLLILLGLYYYIVTIDINGFIINIICII